MPKEKSGSFKLVELSSLNFMRGFRLDGISGTWIKLDYMNVGSFPVLGEEE